MSTSEFASSKLTVGQINAIVKKLGGYEGALKFLQGDLIVSKPDTRNWFEADGTIHLSITSNGFSGGQWLERFRSEKVFVGCEIERILISSDFDPTCGIISQIEILKGMLFKDKDTGRILKKIYDEAKNNGLSIPDAEIFCLLREVLSNSDIKAMGFNYILIMNKDIKEDEDLSKVKVALIGVSGDKLKRLDTGIIKPKQCYQSGFAFIRSQAFNFF